MRVGATLPRIAGVLFSLCCASTAANAAMPIVPPTSGGYAVPIYGEKEELFGVYQAADGHLVLEFIYQDQNGTEGDFYDTQTRQRLFPARSREIATDNAVKAKLVSDAGLKQLRVNDLTAMPMGNLLLKVTEHGPQCRPLPHFLVFSVEQAGHSPIQFSLFTPEAASAQACGQPFAFRYGLLSCGFYAANRDGFFATVYGKPFLIWFDWNGHSTFFSGRSDIVQVPFRDLSRALGNAERNGAGGPREIAPIIDAMTGRYAQNQMHRKAHG